MMGTLPENKPVSYKGYLLKFDTSTSLISIENEKGGAVPTRLKGQFTDRGGAETAITNYLNLLKRKMKTDLKDGEARLKRARKTKEEADKVVAELEDIQAA